MDDVIIVVEPGQPLPNPGEAITTRSGLTGQEYTVIVKAIKHLKWHSKNGNLIVTVKGRKNS